MTTKLNNIDNLIYVGMDLHKKTTTFTAKNKQGEMLSQMKVYTNKDEVTKFVKQFNNQPMTLALEPVSQWYYYADLLERLGVDVHLTHPKKVKAISDKVKTDKIDSETLCELLRVGWLPEAYLSPQEVRGWKEQTRFRVSLVRLRTQVRNKVHAILHKHAYQCEYTDLFGKSGRKWLGSLTFSKEYTRSIKHYLELHDTLTERIDQAAKIIEQTVSDHAQAKLLTTIPSISYVTALTIMAEIGDIKRFPTAKKLMGYAGLVPSTYASGGKVVHGKITKTGSKWLRWIMVETAQRQTRLRKQPGFGWYYRKLKERHGSKTAAVATARKLLAVIWAVLSENREFEERTPDGRKLLNQATDSGVHQEARRKNIVS